MCLCVGGGIGVGIKMKILRNKMKKGKEKRRKLHQKGLKISSFWVIYVLTRPPHLCFSNGNIEIHNILGRHGVSGQKEFLSHTLINEVIS